MDAVAFRLPVLVLKKLVILFCPFSFCNFVFLVTSESFPHPCQMPVDDDILGAFSN